MFQDDRYQEFFVICCNAYLIQIAVSPRALKCTKYGWKSGIKSLLTNKLMKKVVTKLRNTFLLMNAFTAKLCHKLFDIS